MLQPNTSQSKRSIWDGIDREAFECELDALHRTKFVPEPQILEKEEWPRSRKTGFPEFGVELQLADDIAFISAHEYGVEYVTAATVEIGIPGGLTIRLAANEGVCKKVQDAWAQLMPLLERCSAKGQCASKRRWPVTDLIQALSREKCTDDAFNIVTKLNKNRILGRLESRHFERPRYQKGLGRGALWTRFERLLRSTVHSDDSDVALLHRQIADFRVACLRVEESRANLDAIKCAVKSAYQLTVDGYSLLNRLQNAKVTFHVMDKREVREINKLGNYWRICHDLARLSRSSLRPFANLRLELVDPFAASIAHGVTKPRHVHAEVQILVHYETKGGPIWPRAIGVSKEACFLCSSLIKSHGLFFVSKAHRQVYPQWTVPDLPEYSPESLGRLQRALLSVKNEVASVLREARGSRTFRPCPMQSSTNLHKPNLPTPSVTTILSATTGGTQTPRTGTRLPPENATYDRPVAESSRSHEQSVHYGTRRSPRSSRINDVSVSSESPHLSSASIC